MPSKKHKKRPEDLRSNRWFGATDLRSFAHRARMKQIGHDRDDFIGKPIIGIINTWSDINPCHTHLRQRAEEIKRGILQAGGFPIELPAISLSEPFVKPTTMLYRNFLAMETEELLRSHPLDGSVLLGGCDKTTPGLVMGALSMGLPTIFVPAGPMLGGQWRGEALGMGTSTWKYWDELRAGNITEKDWEDIEAGIARSYGHCQVMGTASTMTAVTETIGLTLSGASSIPAPDSSHKRMATESGRRIVDMVWEDLKPSDILTKDSFDNAITVHMALGGSTNAIIHIVAMSKRAGLPMSLQRFDDISRTTPVLANIKPSGEFLMEEFYAAGGLPALLSELKDSLKLKCKTVSGKTLGDDIAHAQVHRKDVIHSLDDPIYGEGATAVLYGNLAPDGCVMKPAAADQKYLKHRGPALVFRDYNHMAAEIDRDDLDVTADTVMVLQNAGPQGGPGMPEWGMMPIPTKLLKEGVRDMLRVSDSRMSGTSYGACILHVAPESFIGGPLAFVQTGDMIEVDVDERRIHLDITDEEMAARRSKWTPPAPIYERGYTKLFLDHIGQADQGCDFDYLEAGAPTPEPEIH
jgi:dihydroxy-acid dehydratase